MLQYFLIPSEIYTRYSLMMKKSFCGLYITYSINSLIEKPNMYIFFNNNKNEIEINYKKH